MAETIYVKYNGTRRKEFQIKTAIRLDQGEKTVDKTALCPEGEAHIRSFEEKYRLLSAESGRLTFLEPEIRGRRAYGPVPLSDRGHAVQASGGGSFPGSRRSAGRQAGACEAGGKRGP